MFEFSGESPCSGEKFQIPATFSSSFLAITDRFCRLGSSFPDYAAQLGYQRWSVEHSSSSTTHLLFDVVIIVEPVIVMWALSRELRTLASLDDAVRQGADLGSAMQAARVWRNREGLLRSCIGRHQQGDFHRLLKASGRADAAAKGQRFGDPWQMAADIVIGMARA